MSDDGMNATPCCHRAENQCCKTDAVKMQPWTGGLMSGKHCVQIGLFENIALSAGCDPLLHASNALAASPGER